MFYILDNDTPKEVDAMTWAHWFNGNSDKRIIKQTYVRDNLVSTVFIGIDYHGSKRLYETVIFQNNESLEGAYASSREEALELHDFYVAGLEKNPNE